MSLSGHKLFVIELAEITVGKSGEAVRIELFIKDTRERRESVIIRIDGDSAVTFGNLLIEAGRANVLEETPKSRR